MTHRFSSSAALCVVSLFASSVVALITPVRAADSPTAPPTPTASAALNPQIWPEARELVLGRSAVEVRPARSIKVKAPFAGPLHLRQRASGPLAEGVIWAEFDPERLAIERDALELSRLLMAEKDQPAARFDEARQRAELVERLAELERQRGMLTRLRDDPALGKLYLDENGPGRRPADLKELLASLDRQLELLNTVIAYAGTSRQAELENRALGLKLRQQELEFNRHQAEGRLAMPFTGELTLLVPPPTDDRPLRIEQGDTLAVLQDFSSIEARMILRRTEWRRINPVRLVLAIGDDRTPLRATFSRAFTEDFQGREELIYTFTFDASQRAAARSLVGGQVNARLLVTLPETARLAPKLDLMLANPAAFRYGGWQVGINTVLPGAKLLEIGETQLALVPGGANGSNSANSATPNASAATALPAETGPSGSTGGAKP